MRLSRPLRLPSRHEGSGVLTTNSPRGFGSSDGNHVFCFEFGLEVGQERVREDVRERVQELGVHSVSNSVE
jgi:hypothetical protein